MLLRMEGLMRRYVLALAFFASPAMAQTPEESAAAAVTEALEIFCTPFITPPGGLRDAVYLPALSRETPADMAIAERIEDAHMAQAGMSRPPLTDALRAEGWAEARDEFGDDYRREAPWGAVTVDIRDTSCLVKLDLPDAATPPVFAMDTVDAWATRTLAGAVRIGAQRLNPEIGIPARTDNDWWYAESGILVSAGAGMNFPAPDGAGVVYRPGHFLGGVHYRAEPGDRATHERIRRQLVSRPPPSRNTLRPN
jgi:hypothetical protein